MIGGHTTFLLKLKKHTNIKYQLYKTKSEHITYLNIHILENNSWAFSSIQSKHSVFG